MSTENTQTDPVREQFDRYVIPNYSRFPVEITRGEGSYVWDAEGNRYLDLFPGWGCNLLGHCPPPVVEAVDTLGAGDIFHGAYCHFLGQGSSFTDALELAGRIAAQSCRYFGTREWISHLQAGSKTTP